MKKIAFIIPPSVELLDFAGPVQVFTEAKDLGLDIEMEFYQFKETPVSSAGLGFESLKHFKEAQLKEGDYVFMPGMDYDYVKSIAFKSEKAFFDWLKECSDQRIPFVRYAMAHLLWDMQNQEMR